MNEIVVNIVDKIHSTVSVNISSTMCKAISILTNLQLVMIEIYAMFVGDNAESEMICSF